MITSVGYWTAFSAGIVSFLSPCLLPLIPAYILYISGSLDAEETAQNTRRAVVQTLGFILGFTVIFMLLGISASALGRLLISHKDLLSKISGLFIMFFGAYMAGWIKLPFMGKDYRKRVAKSKMTFISAVGMGMAFAFGWTPCFGPILGAILASTAAISTNVSQGVLLLFVYSMGMAVPFLLTAIFLNAFSRWVDVFSKHARVINTIAGVIMILLGALMFLGKLQQVANWLLSLGH